MGFCPSLFCYFVRMTWTHTVPAVGLFLACASAGTPATSGPSYGQELVGPPRKELRAPDEWVKALAECNELKLKAAKQAGECNAEINLGCDGKDELRQLGECPHCDELDKLNGELRQKDCWVNTRQ